MKAILQYSANLQGPYKSVGLVRSKKDQHFKVIAMTENDRLGIPQTIGYEVQVTALALQLNYDFLNSSPFYFRLFYPKRFEEIRLGYRTYRIDFDGLITRNQIVYHTVFLKFHIKTDEYQAYTQPQGGLIEDQVNIDDFDEGAAVYI